jgi:hypothetical protein
VDFAIVGKLAQTVLPDGVTAPSKPKSSNAWMRKSVIGDFLSLQLVLSPGFDPTSQLGVFSL